MSNSKHDSEDLKSVIQKDDSMLWARLEDEKVSLDDREFIRNCNTCMSTTIIF